MPLWVMVYVIYCAAALAEIAGCFSFWAWLKLEKTALWIVPGMLALALFAWLLTLVPSAAAGRAYAAYGGIYIAASISRRLLDGFGLSKGSVRIDGT